MAALIRQFRDVVCLALAVLTFGFAGTVPAQADFFGRDTGGSESSAPDSNTPAETVYTAETLIEAMPLIWRGTFAWDDGVAYFVEMEIVKLTVRPDGEVAFNAETRWSPDGLEARMSGRIDPATLTARIWEIAEDTSAESFDSDGQYDGAFAADLWDMRARWRTNATGETGILVMIADSLPAVE